MNREPSHRLLLSSAPAHRGTLGKDYRRQARLAVGAAAVAAGAVHAAQVVGGRDGSTYSYTVLVFVAVATSLACFAPNRSRLDGALGLGCPVSIGILVGHTAGLGLGHWGVVLAFLSFAGGACLLGAIRSGQAIAVARETRNASGRQSEQRAVQQLSDELRTSQKLASVGELSVGLAHDLNNLLQLVVFQAERASELEPSASSSTLENIAEAARRGGKLTKRLLKFGAEGSQPRTWIDINAVVGDVLPLIRVMLPKNVHLDVACSPDAGAILGSAIEIDQLLINLCINARDAMPKGGRLRIETGTSANADTISGAFLTVTDTGIGMSEECQRTAFDSFATFKEGGTGLGLTVVRHVVESYEGSLELSSALGQGSCFRIVLPREPAPPVSGQVLRRAIREGA